MKPYNLSASGCSHLSIPLSCNNFSCVLLFIVLNFSPQSILFVVHVPTTTTSLHAPLTPSFVPSLPLQLPTQPEKHHVPTPIPLLRSSSVEAPSLANSPFPPLARPEEQLLARGGCAEVTTEHLERQSWQMPPRSPRLSFPASKPAVGTQQGKTNPLGLYQKITKQSCNVINK